MTEPYNLEAEQSVLGSILIDPDGAIPQVIDILSEGDFYISGHGTAYREMINLYGLTRAVDYVTIAERLKPIGQIEGQQISKYMLFLAQLVPSIANVKAYAEIVCKNAKARKVRNALLSAIDEEVTAENVDEVSESVMSTVYESTSKEKKTGLKPLKDITTDWYCNLFKTGSQKRIDTGYSDLDALLCGLWGDELIILAARPSVGKTAFALSIAQRVASKGKTVNFFSEEMSKEQLLERMVANQSWVDMTSIVNTETLLKNQEQIGKVASGIDIIRKLPINICDDAAITVNQIQAQSRMTQDLALIIVDYIQLMPSTKKHASRNDEVGEISRGLKLLSKSLHVPVIALSQLNREVEHRGISKPGIADLRDSGNIEQDADKIIFGWKPDPDANVVQWDVAKNRRGKLGSVQDIFDGSHMSYRQLVKSDYIKPKQTKSKMQYNNDF